MSLSIIPERLAKKPVVIAIDDTTIAKFGKKFADIQYLYDHSITIPKTAWLMVIVL